VDEELEMRVSVSSFLDFTRLQQPHAASALARIKPRDPPPDSLIRCRGALPLVRKPLCNDMAPTLFIPKECRRDLVEEGIFVLDFLPET
jgi:hypothetical protein